MATQTRPAANALQAAWPSRQPAWLPLPEVLPLSEFVEVMVFASLASGVPPVEAVVELVTRRALTRGAARLFTQEFVRRTGLRGRIRRLGFSRGKGSLRWDLNGVDFREPWVLRMMLEIKGVGSNLNTNAFGLQFVAYLFPQVIRMVWPGAIATDCARVLLTHERRAVEGLPSCWLLLAMSELAEAVAAHGGSGQINGTDRAVARFGLLGDVLGLADEVAMTLLEQIEPAPLGVAASSAAAVEVIRQVVRRSEVRTTWSEQLEAALRGSGSPKLTRAVVRVSDKRSWQYRIGVTLTDGRVIWAGASRDASTIGGYIYGGSRLPAVDLPGGLSYDTAEADEPFADGTLAGGAWRVCPAPWRGGDAAGLRQLALDELVRFIATLAAADG